jgi:hypothetical protein
MQTADAPLTARDMALLRLAARNDGPLVLTGRDITTAKRLRNLTPPLMQVRTVRSERGQQQLGELTADGRRAVRRALAHA